MIHIIPEREIMLSVTDKNVASTQSTTRCTAFHKANYLLAQKEASVEIVVEGILYNKIHPRLNDDHKRIFEKLYNINESAVGVTNYDITKAIKFISNKKVELPKGKVIIITEKVDQYSDLSHCSIRVYSPQDFIERTNRFDKIKDNFNSNADAIITAFFM
jgi:hypothetical protein